MSLRVQLSIGTLLIMAGLLLMVYTVYALAGMPYVYAPVLLWLSFVEYALLRAWWPDVCEVFSERRGRA